MSPGPSSIPSINPDRRVRIDHTLIDLIFLILSIITLGSVFVIFVKPQCEHSYIHSWYKYFDHYEHISYEEYQQLHADD